ncbi:MAG: hypothetical protein KC621_14125, partial [Myxococcales bacterium]|nr:hypothetical protein [Myxococcales bacterium]
MLIGLLASPSLAQDAEDPACFPPMLVGTMPADGDVDVRPDAVITVVLRADGPSCGGAFLFGELWDVDGEPVPVTLEVDPTGLVFTLVPE